MTISLKSLWKRHGQRTASFPVQIAQVGRSVCQIPLTDSLFKPELCLIAVGEYPYPFLIQGTNVIQYYPVYVPMSFNTTPSTGVPSRYSFPNSSSISTSSREKLSHVSVPSVCHDLTRPIDTCCGTSTSTSIA